MLIINGIRQYPISSGIKVLGLDVIGILAATCAGIAFASCSVPIMLGAVTAAYLSTDRSMNLIGGALGTGIITGPNPYLLTFLSICSVGAGIGVATCIFSFTAAPSIIGILCGVATIIALDRACFALEDHLAKSFTPPDLI